MNDHNLDDLIIDNIKPKNAKTKNILTIVALLIVLFIVAIILTSVVLDDPKSDPAILETNDSEMVSPELTLQSVTQDKTDKNEPKLNEIIEEELNKPVEAPKAVAKKEEKATPKPAVAKKPEVVEKTEVPKIETPTVARKSVEITKEFEQSPINEEVKTETKKVAGKENTIPAAKPKQTEKKVSAPKATATAKSASAVSAITYYIQVGSYKGAPSNRFLTVIKNNGFHYKITAPAANGTKKLLIGPYASRKSVDTALIRVRDLINKSAFVVKK